MSTKPLLQYLLPETSEIYKKSDFEFQRKIGSGAFGQVWRVRNKKTLELFAIKQVQKLKILRLLDQFKRELSIMYVIEHPYIVKLFSHFEDDKFVYMVLELAEGGTLFYKLTQENVLLERVAAQYFREIVSAVEYLHSCDPAIIHRDIKPENLLIQKTGEIKLTDFGWANFVAKTGERMTHCGTLEYLPPEMIDEKGHDTSADIWCLGILLYEMLAGITPFKANGREKVLTNITKSTLKFPRGFPALAKDLIGKILTKDKSARLSISQIMSHKWLQTTPPLREFKTFNRRNETECIYQNDETENSCSENEIEDEVKKGTENVYRKSVVFLKVDLERKSSQVKSQRNSLKILSSQLASENARAKELEEQVEDKKKEIGKVLGGNKELLAKIFDLNLDLEKLQDDGSEPKVSLKDYMNRYLELKKKISLQSILLDNLKHDVLTANKTHDEAENRLKSHQIHLKELREASVNNKTKQKSSMYELKLNLDVLKIQLEEKKKNFGINIDQNSYKEITNSIKAKMAAIGMQRELSHKLEVIEEIVNEKEQQISELSIEFEMKRSQRLYNLRKRKDELSRHNRKLREEARLQFSKIAEQQKRSLKDQLALSRSQNLFVDSAQIDSLNIRIKNLKNLIDRLGKMRLKKLAEHKQNLEIIQSKKQNIDQVESEISQLKSDYYQKLYLSERLFNY